MKPSEATLAWEAWRARRRLTRNWGAWGLSVGTAVLAVGLAAWGGFLPLINVGEQGESLSVKLGNPDGEDLPLSVSALPDPAMQAVMTAMQDSAITAVEETRSAEPEPDAIPVSKPKPKPTPKPVQTPANPVKPTEAPPVDAKPVVTEKVIRGSEKGNASELILKPQGEKISQNAYWPVYLFMPLPTRLDGALLARVRETKLYTAEERQQLLLQFYSKTAEGLVLNSDPGLPVRPALWEILEGAGYDVVNAEYKRGRPLVAVVINFKLGVPKGPGENPALLEVKLDQGSGNPAVDEAVLYAFQKSTFANGTGQVAQGRYTYDFSGKK